MRNHRLFRTLSAAILAGLMGASLVACGGGSSSSAGSAGTTAHNDPVSRAVATVQRPMRGTGGNEVNDDNPGKADSGSSASPASEDPCRLVSHSEAEAIIGEPIATPQEAPLGPTCIFRGAKSTNKITLELESADFTKIREQLHKATKATLGGHTVYCGQYGGPLTIASAGSYRLVKVSAPCAIGPALAVAALKHLPRN